jgi:predicted phosphodiesterase
MNLKIAVISDLHCHNKRKNGNLQDSYFLTDVNIPDNQNPIASFRDFIKEKHDKGEEVSVDILIMPGDITNKCDEEGFTKGWEVTKEIGALLNAKFIIPTIGNHDVDSRKLYSSDPFLMVKNLANDFPFTDTSKNDEFWKTGFVFIEDENFRILIVNSAFSHNSIKQAEHGYISQESLNCLDAELDALEKNKKKYNIAICHHHPIPHERHNLGTHDLIENGTELADLLGKYSFQIIIHGHKHDPLVRYASGGTNSPVVFSAGSFSAFKNLLLQGAYNTFHIITLEHEEKKDCVNHGKIKTWFFTPSKGWDSQVKNEYIDANVGFGCRTIITALANEIHQWFLSNTINNYEWNDFIPSFEMINYLLPNDKIKLGRFLKEKMINVYPSFPSEPEIISFKRT